MLLILFSWIYITFTCVNSGFIFSKVLSLDIKNFAVTVILGLFGITLFAGFWAIFYRINWEFHVVLLLLNCVICLTQKKGILNCYRQFLEEVKELNPFMKLLLSTVTFLILAQCSLSPNITDNETYYIQSIKWLNEYGFVKGLANLHPFLAQMSGWHIAQSAFSFSFLYNRFNDLSGFMLLAGNVFAIAKLIADFKNQNKLYLAIGLLPIANVFLFQFISAPSPDLPVYILTLIIFFYFVENYNTASAEVFKLMLTFALFNFYIKPTSALLLLFPAIYFVRYISVLKKQLLAAAAITGMLLPAFILKNCIISGNPLFPYTGLSIDTDYTLPTELANFYVDLTKRYAFHLSSAEFKSITDRELFIQWLTLPGLHGFFNKTAVILVLAAPMVIYRFFNKKAVWIVYAVMCLQLVTLYVTSPQYRFFFNFILVFALAFLALVLKNKSAINSVLAFATSAVAITLFVPINLGSLTQNKLMQQKTTFSSSTIVCPAPNSKYPSGYKTLKAGNLIYHSPDKTDNFWITGNAPLPAVSEEQLKYFRKKYGYTPQLRGTSLADGFYSKHVAK